MTRPTITTTTAATATARSNARGRKSMQRTMIGAKMMAIAARVCAGNIIVIIVAREVEAVTVRVPAPAGPNRAAVIAIVTKRMGRRRKRRRN